MRILFLTLGSPLDADRGAQIRDRELILRVAEHHDVGVLAVLEPGRRLGTDAALEERCEVLAPAVVDGRARAVARRAIGHVRRGRPLASLPWVSDELRDRLSAIAREGRWDVVQIEHSFLASYVTCLPGTCRTVLSLHNVGRHQYESMARAAGSARERSTLRVKARLVGRLERSHLSRFDAVVVVSEAERSLLDDYAPGLPVTVVPNGVDAAVQPLEDNGLPGTVLFVGNLAYPPNAQAVLDFCKRSLPHLRARVPNVTLLVLGADAPPEVAALAGDDVRILGRVEEVEPWYSRAQVVVVPLRAGGGTRLKVLEAMAFGRCVVSTPVGVEGLDITDGREALLAEPGLPFARRCEEALRSAELRRAVADRARAFVESKHSWDDAARRLLELYAPLVTSAPRGSTIAGDRSAPGSGGTSVIIPAYRADATLPSVLDALEPQLGSDREAIVVESGVDGRGSQLAHRWPWLRVLSTPDRLLPGQARNLGAAHARGELLAFLDADAVPSRDWLDRLEEELRFDDDAVAGAIVNGTPQSRIGTAEYLLNFSETLPRRARAIRHGPSANLLVRRDHFQAAGGFAEALRAGEDTVLTFPIARRQRLAFAPSATVSHLNRTQLRAFLVNQRVQGAGFVAVCRTVAYPNGWVCRGSALMLAGPLRLLALGRCLLSNPAQRGPALRALPQLVLGTAAWVLGAAQARRRGGLS